MIRFVALSSMFLAGLAAPTLPAQAASFDCGKAATPFEHAICDNPELSAADELLARSYATAAGGLTEPAAEALRQGQREWLDYARKACTTDAEPLTSGRYSGDAVSCLSTIFASRSSVLEASRMVDGLRFYPLSDYSTLPDPDNVGEPAWAVAQHEMSYVQVDDGPDYAQGFNEAVRAEAQAMQGSIDPDDPDAEVGSDASSDTTNSITVDEISGNRITLLEDTYWYGHGAAHGNYTISYLHYLTDQGRWMEAGDIFSGKKWQAALLDLAVEALHAQHDSEMLMLDDTQYIAEPVINPRRWDFSSPYGLTIQFEPYEVAAYAYGAPSVTISWDKLEPYLAESADLYR